MYHEPSIAVGKCGLFVVLFFFFLSAGIHSQTQQCFVRFTFHDLDQKAFSSFHELARFRVSRGNEVITKSFLHDESGVNVNVGVEFPDRTYGNKDAGLKLAIAFSGKPEDVFDAVGGAEATSSADEPLKSSIMLSKSIKGDGRTWTFFLSCMPESRLPKSMRDAKGKH